MDKHRQSILTDVRYLLDNPRAPVYIIDGIIEENSTGAVIGASGSGKTFLGLDLSASIAVGTDFCNLPTKQGQVVYMAGEGRQGLARRLLAWEQKHNKRIPSNQLITSNKTIIMDSAGARTLLEAINQMNLDNVQLLVIDTLSRHMDGEENSNTAMGDFMTVVDDIRDRLGCSVVIIHHPGYGNGTQNRARGASAFYAALDFELLVKQTQAGYSIKGTKSKEGQLWEEHIFDLEAIPIQGMYDNKGSQVKSAVINWKGKSDTKSGSSQTKAETKALRIFQVALDTSGTDRIVNGLNVRSIDLEKWREHSYQTCTTDNNNSKNTIFNRQKNTLLAAGLVEEHNDLYTLPIETKQNHNNVVTMLRTSSVT